jgi:hypothetical protein
VKPGFFLIEEDINSNIVLPNIYGVPEYRIATCVKFALDNETKDFGFYVHCGAGRTYFYTGEDENDRDFYGGYVGAAIAIRTQTMKHVTLKAIDDGEAAIAKAEAEGRTKGLADAVCLLREAQAYLSKNYDEALRCANDSIAAANDAVNPSFFESYGLLLGVLIVIGFTTGGSVAIRRRHKIRNIEDKG